MSRRGFGVSLLVLLCGGLGRQVAAQQAQANGGSPWTILPPTPPLPAPKVAGMVQVGDVRLYRAEFGEGEPVLFLHGGLAHSNYWGHQVGELAQRYRVIVMDTRGHGRSTFSPRPFSYALLASDAVGLLDALKIPKAAIVGWSDGAIAGLQIAMRRPDRLSRLFAFGANFNLQGVRPGTRGPAFLAFTERCRQDYVAMSPAAGNWNRLVAGLRKMWGTEPNYSRTALSRIRTSTVVAGADHDEIIPQAHTQELAGAIPDARLVQLSGVSHFAMLQNPARFSAELLTFLRP